MEQPPLSCSVAGEAPSHLQVSVSSSGKWELIKRASGRAWPEAWACWGAGKAATIILSKWAVGIDQLRMRPGGPLGLAWT